MFEKIVGKYFVGIGLDISDHHARFAVVSAFKGVVDLYELVLPEGIIDDEKVVKDKDLKKILGLGIAKLRCPRVGPIKISLLVPESRVFSTSVILAGKIIDPVVKTEALRRAQKAIPIPFNQAVVAVSQGETVEGGFRANVYACQKEVLAGLLRAVDSPLLKPVAVEANTKALLRLYTRFADKPERVRVKNNLVCVVDIGHSWSTISVYTQYGSSLFSRTLEHKTLVLTPDKPLALPDQVVETILQTVAETKQFFVGQDLKIARTILAGVEALHDKLLEAGEKDEIKAIGDLIVAPMVSGEELHRFGAAIGAAYRALFNRKFAYQHNFLNGQ